MRPPFRVLVAGHVCLDLFPAVDTPLSLEPGQLHELGPLRMAPGGCVANTGADLAALGAQVRLVGNVGDDPLGVVVGDLLRARAADADVLLTVVPNGATSYSIGIQPPSRDRTLWHHVGANASFDGAAVDVGSSDLVHLGYPPLLPALLIDGAAPLRALLGRAKAAGGTTSVDLAVVDSATAAGQADWPTLLRRVLPDVDVLTPSADDLQSLLRRPVGRDRRGLQAAAEELIGYGAGVVAVSAGAAGMALHTASRERLAAGGAVLAAVATSWGDQHVALPAKAVTPVRTTGAGDTATAGLLFGLLAGLGPEEALALATAAAAVHVSGEDLEPYGDGSGYRW